ncbi:hypothetical protein Pan54_12320 [Rubinisphaera italica]|uniref:Uncharacterized protein n=1 Tax=Rubinisphaera italica TaxID=2527969 RepID=A0A5C5XCK1_9PLAN|nr:hypothetical protein Pan54_12320 [Rubinisphaera italica]
MSHTLTAKEERERGQNLPWFFIKSQNFVRIPSIECEFHIPGHVNKIVPSVEGQDLVTSNSLSRIEQRFRLLVIRRTTNAIYEDV